MYKIIFSDLSLKQLEKLDRHLKERIISSIEKCRIRPYSYIKKLVFIPYFVLRVGDYRVILKIFENELRVLVIKVGHRKSIYKNL